jgi:hypothetical protein
VLLHDRRFFERIRLLKRAALQFYPARPKFERIRQRRSAAGGSCSCTTEDFLNEFGCSGEQPSSFILHDQNLNEFGSAGALLEGRAPARPKNFRRLCRSTALQRPQFFGLPICRFHDLPIRFGSAGASPSHHALRSHPFRSFHGIIATNMKMVRGAMFGAGCDVLSAG